MTIREAHAHTGWLESLTRGVVGEGLRGIATLPVLALGVAKRGQDTDH